MPRGQVDDKQIFDLTKIYILKTNPNPTNREVDEYIHYSIQYFGSKQEYVKILQDYYQLQQTTQQSK